MPDDTRAAASGLELEAAPVWLEALCPRTLRSEIARHQREAEVLRTLVASWARSARDVVRRYEAGFEGQFVPDEAYAAITDLTGLADLLETALDLAQLCSFERRLDAEA